MGLCLMMGERARSYSTAQARTCGGRRGSRLEDGEVELDG